MEACSASPKAGISPLVDNHLDAIEQTELPYQVRIENFEGPLDLLLHLIKKSEINIYDIPIHLIAQQYLTYIEAMEDLNLTVAGEDALLQGGGGGLGEAGVYCEQRRSFR